MPLEIVEQQARMLAKDNREAEPDILEVYWFPHDEEVRLVELTPSIPTSGDGRVRPFYFRSNPADDLPAPSGIALIGPKSSASWRPPPTGAIGTVPCASRPRNRVELAECFPGPSCKRQRGSPIPERFTVRLQPPAALSADDNRKAVQRVLRARQRNRSPRTCAQRFVRLLQTLKHQSRTRQQLGFQDQASFRSLINSLLDLAHQIERLAPNFAGFTRPNPEYPWRDLGTGAITAPEEYPFTEFDPRQIKMIQMEALLDGLLMLET